MLPPPIDLDKAEKMIDKMIEDGSFQKMADQQAEILNRRLEDFRRKDETEAEKKFSAESLACHEAEKAIRNYIDFYKDSRDPLEIIGNHVYNFFGDITNMTWGYSYHAAELLNILDHTYVKEGFEKAQKSGSLHDLVEILKQLIQFCVGLTDDELTVAIVKYGDYSAYGHTMEEYLITRAEYEHKLRFLQERKGIEDTHKEAMKD